MNTRGQLILLWTTPAVGVLMLLAFLWFPGFWPPMSPTMSADEVGAFIQANVASIRGISIYCNLIGGMLLPFYAVIAVQMLRIVNSSPVFAYAYIIAAGINMSALLIADYCWGLAAFRPERDPQLLSLLNDMAWFFFITPTGLIVIQNLCLALSIYLDARSKPVFPRWVAHFNVLTAALMAPGALAILYKTGPFAWDGSIAFTLRITTFIVYVVVMFFVLLRVVKQPVEKEGIVL